MVSKLNCEMSADEGQQMPPALQQDLQNELTTSNHILRLVYLELQEIKSFLRSNGTFENNIHEIALSNATLGQLRKINMKNLPPMIREQIDMSNHTNQNFSHEQHETFRNSSGMNDSQE